MSPKLSDLFLRSQSDERLVSLVREGHERAFAVIVERYRRELLACARRLRSDGRAEDLVQQTFLSAFSALATGVEVTHLRGWLYQILRNASISASKRPDAEHGLEPETIASEPLEDTVERRMLTRDVLAEVATLPGRQRDALVAMAIHGHSRAAVATSMGLSEGAVRQLMHRARAALRRSVAGVTPWPLARWWLATARTGSAGDRLSQVSAGAATASAGGVTVKLAAVLVSGVVATGIVSAQMNMHHARHRASVGVSLAHRAASAGGRASGARAASVSEAVGAAALVGTAIAERRSQGAHPSAAEGGVITVGSGDRVGSSGGSDGGSGGGFDEGNNGGQAPSSSGSSNDGGSSSSDGGSSASSQGGEGGTQTTTPPAGTSESQDGGGGSGSSAIASAADTGGGGGSGSGDGGSGGGGTTTPVPSSSTSSVSGLSGDSGSSGTSGSSGRAG